MAKEKQKAAAFTPPHRKSTAIRYLLYLPGKYEKDDRDWPLMLFLHGAGERGNDLDAVKRHGPPKLVEQGKRFSFILVSPQCPEDELWSADALRELLDDIEAHYKVDRSRIYLTGLSMGGFGTWKLAMMEPDRFAAIAPICGWGDVNSVCVLKEMPVWAFHGKKDNVVPVGRTEALVKALQACGGNVRMTIYPEAGHDSWTETYNNPKLFRWLLEQQRG